MKNGLFGVFEFGYRALTPDLNRFVRANILGQHQNVRLPFVYTGYRSPVAPVFSPSVIATLPVHTPLTIGTGVREIHTVAGPRGSLLESDREEKAKPVERATEAAGGAGRADNGDEEAPRHFLDSGEDYTQVQEAYSIIGLSAYDVLDKPELTEAEKLLVVDELDRRLLNISDTILDRDGIEGLDALARALGLDIRDVMYHYFIGIDVPEEERLNLFESIRDLRALIQNYAQGTLVRSDYDDLAQLLIIFGLDENVLAAVSVRSSDGWAGMIIQIVGSLIEDYQKKESTDAAKASGEVSKLADTDLD